MASRYQKIASAAQELAAWMEETESRHLRLEKRCSKCWEALESLEIRIDTLEAADNDRQRNLPAEDRRPASELDIPAGR